MVTSQSAAMCALFGIEFFFFRSNFASFSRKYAAAASSDSTRPASSSSSSSSYSASSASASTSLLSSASSLRSSSSSYGALSPVAIGRGGVADSSSDWIRLLHWALGAGTFLFGWTAMLLCYFEGTPRFQAVFYFYTAGAIALCLVLLVVFSWQVCVALYPSFPVKLWVCRCTLKHIHFHFWKASSFFRPQPFSIAHTMRFDSPSFADSAARLRV
jgi:hypothetical protein